jgi:hypothetical protein
MRGDIAHPSHGTQTQLLRISLDAGKINMLQVDKLSRRLDIILQQLHQVRAAGDEFHTMLTCSRQRCIERGWLR